MGRKRKDQTSLNAIDAVDPLLVDAAEPEMVELIEAPEVATASIAQPTKWLVLEDQVVSLFGQMTTLPAGTVVSVGSYGPVGIKRIMEQGVVLEPVG